MADRQHLREALIDQLAYLTDEVEAQKAFLRALPVVLLEDAPLPGDLSIKQRYGVLIAADERVHLPQLRQMVTAATPASLSLSTPAPTVLAEAEAWQTLGIDTLLPRLQQARHALVAFLRGLSQASWDATTDLDGEPCDVYTYVHRITQHDVDQLRAIGYRLHEGRAIR